MFPTSKYLLNKKKIKWCGYSSTMDRHCIEKCFAEYSTEAKAIKAMEMLHEEWRDYGECGIFQFPTDNEAETWQND